MPTFSDILGSSRDSLICAKCNHPKILTSLNLIFIETFPETILLVDTYDIIAGVRNVIRLARELDNAFRINGIRLNSGDLGSLAKECRKELDKEGLESVKYFAGGGIDEDRIRDLLADGAPISGFGVGTAMGVSDDVPALDIGYKISACKGERRLKL